MKITLRTNADDWFLSNVQGNNYTVSMTANFRGFTPSNAMLNDPRYIRWSKDEITRIEDSCNTLQEVMIFDYFSPSLLLVPKTRGKSDTKALMKNKISNYFVPFIGFSDDDVRNVESMKKHFDKKDDNILQTYLTAGGEKRKY